MSRKLLSVVALIAAASLLVSLSSCGFNQHLTSIRVEPPGATFLGVGAQIQFTAIGTYIHPPQTKDITSQVHWAIDSQNLATVTSSGFVTSTSICGSGNLTASLNAPPNFVSGSAFLTGSGIGTSACNQGALTVSVSGSGTVTSSPTGINCPGTCGFVFTLNSTVVLTAAMGTGASSVTWTGCDSNTTTTCTVAITGNRSVTATFT
jgi:Bacterial Ig-like domain (group 2)